MRVTSKGLRDLFFLLVGTAILYREFWQQADPSPLGAFLALFLYGLIPAFRADETGSTGPLGLLLQALAALGVKGPKENPGTPGDREDPAEREAREAEVAREAARVVLAERVEREAQRRKDEGKPSPPRSDEPGSSS